MNYLFLSFFLIKYDIVFQKPKIFIPLVKFQNKYSSRFAKNMDQFLAEKNSLLIKY